MAWFRVKRPGERITPPNSIATISGANTAPGMRRAYRPRRLRAPSARYCGTTVFQLTWCDRSPHGIRRTHQVNPLATGLSPGVWRQPTAAVRTSRIRPDWAVLATMTGRSTKIAVPMRKIPSVSRSRALTPGYTRPSPLISRYGIEDGPHSHLLS